MISQRPFFQTPYSFTCSKIFPLLFVLLFHLVVAAQVNTNAANDSIFNKYAAGKGIHFNTEEPHVIQYKEQNGNDIKGAKTLRNISAGIAIVQIKDSAALAENSGIEKIAVAHHGWKLSPLLEKREAGLLQQPLKKRAFSILATNLDTFFAILRKQGFSFTIIAVYRETNAAVIQCSAAAFCQFCLPQPQLLFADVYVPAAVDAMISGYHRNISSINAADHFFPEANGRNITIGIKEKSPDEADMDVQKRMLPSPIASAEKDNHATIVATLAGGAGNSFYTGKGPASKCLFFPSSFSNLFPDSFLLLQQNGVTVQNHSYGTVIQPYYGAEALAYDVQTNNNKTLLHVFSSGNRGTESATTGPYAHLPGFANLTGNFKNSKNVITVAAADTGSRLTLFSSAGPVYDGRLAPQITALGPNGTSDAAALVSGAAAVLQQVYKDSDAGVVPPASLVKALLFTTTDDIGSRGIDYRSGYGLLNLYSALKCLKNKQYDGNSLGADAVWTKNITLPPGAANLKITLCWTDTAALANNNRALVNDLDLEVVENSTGAVLMPWVLSTVPHADSLAKSPERKRDSLNVTEQVSMAFPQGGQYGIRVRARQIGTVQQQPFHIAYTWDTLNTLQFTNPVQSADIDRAENPVTAIQWKAVLADTNTRGTLSISYNRGGTWQLIAAGILLKNGRYNWVIPDTTAVTVLRMESVFGQFYSAPFVLSPLSKINVDFLCSDSLRLSWQKNRLATAYRLFALSPDTAFIRPIIVVTDTFAVLNRVLFPQNVYAVQPVLPNGPEAARSIALDVRNQGVSCLYKTLLAEAAGDRIQLTLQMSFTSTVDSITFEKVSPTGNGIRRLGTVFPQTSVFNYSIWDDAPATGTNYYRAKIWTANKFIYTDIVSILHTGKEFLVVYPNPVQSGQKIQYLLPESMGTGTLLVTDITGRSVGKYSLQLSGTLPTWGWAKGTYLYKLLGNDGQMKAKGKILIL